MRRGRGTIAAAVLACALAPAGCGGSSANDIAKIQFTSPVIPNGTIPALYTCDGRNISPPLEWGAVPPGTGELAVFLLGFTPNPTGNRYKATMEWAVSGLSPALHRLNPGKLPPGARLGLNTNNKRRYSLCPKSHEVEHYQFELYAVSASVAIPASFVGFSVVAQLANSKPSGATLGHGLFDAVYERHSRQTKP
jgi:phosphatidylethanolamine-binding protein (PEBP) family uncharacterized protein